MPTLEVSCRGCEKVFVPVPADYRAGRWRLCPACRERPAAAASDDTSGTRAERQRTRFPLRFRDRFPAVPGDGDVA